MTLIKHYRTRLICLTVIIGSHYFCKAQSYTYTNTKRVAYQSAQNREIKKTLRDALADVGKKYNVSFVYLDKLVDNKVVTNTISGQSSNLDQELSALLKESDLLYRKISDKQIA